MPLTDGEVDTTEKQEGGGAVLVLWIKFPGLSGNFKVKGIVKSWNSQSRDLELEY